MAFLDPSSSNAPWRRTDEQIQIDRDFLIEHLKEGNSFYLHNKLMDEIKRRGDTYTLTYQQTCSEIRAIKAGAIRRSEINIANHIDETLAMIEEQIELCLNEIEIRMHDRLELVGIEKDSLVPQDLKALPDDVKEVFYIWNEYFKKEKEIWKKTRGGSDTRDPMEILYKWIGAKRELLGLDAPKRVLKKIDKTVEHNYTIDQLRKKYKELGSPELFKELIKEITEQPIKHKKKGENGSD